LRLAAENATVHIRPSPRPAAGSRSRRRSAMGRGGRAAAEGVPSTTADPARGPGP